MTTMDELKAAHAALMEFPVEQPDIGHKPGVPVDRPEVRSLAQPFRAIGTAQRTGNVHSELFLLILSVDVGRTPIALHLAIRGHIKSPALDQHLSLSNLFNRT